MLTNDPLNSVFKRDPGGIPFVEIEVFSPEYLLKVTAADGKEELHQGSGLFLGSEEAFCFDIRSNESLSIPRQHQAKISTGLHMAMPLLSGLIMRERSGLADKGVRIGAGTIDSDYRGELKVLVRYEPLVDVKDPLRSIPDILQINRGDRICQAWIALSLTQLVRLKFVDKTSDLSKTLRGAGGFGSTGVG